MPGQSNQDSKGFGPESWRRGTLDGQPRGLGEGDKMCSLHLSYTLTTGTQCSSVTHCHLPPGTWTVAQSLSWMRTGKEEKL